MSPLIVPNDGAFWRNKDAIQVQLNDTIVVQMRVSKSFDGSTVATTTGWQLSPFGALTHRMRKDYFKQTAVETKRLTKKRIEVEFEKFITNWPSIKDEVMAFYKIGTP